MQLALAGPHTAAPQEPAARPSLTVSAFGMHLHAATTVDGRDRKQLERLCRYLLRPPFAHDAVKALPDGRVRVLFKAPWRSGVAHADMTADKFLAQVPGLAPAMTAAFIVTFAAFALALVLHLRAWRQGWR
ncbi:MAG: transposase [Nannocystis sp.]|nr:transposase [Nannocystis sp.]